MSWLLIASSVALYLLPAFAYAWVAGRVRPAPAFVRALDAATAMGADAMLVLLLAKRLPLHDAVWVARALWACLLVGAAGRWRALPRPSAGAALVAASVGALVWWQFHRTSYELVIWDRDWHVPLSSLLRVETVPFENVYVPRATLRYHFLGDVIAAELQSLSGGRMHAALALSVAHDLYLAMTGALLACALGAADLRAWGLGPAKLSWRGALGLVASPWLALPVLFAGPMVLLNVEPSQLTTVLDSGLLCGRTHLGYASLAYRPHVVVAGFYAVAVLLAVLVRTRPETQGTSAGRTTAALLASSAALALLDEASLAVLACGLGAAWALVPGAAHPSRWKGALVVAAFAAMLPLVSTLFDASLSPGGAAQRTEWVPARHLELFEAPLRYAENPTAFRDAFLVDYFPYWTTGGLLVLLAVWTRRRDVAAATAFFLASAAASCVLALKFEVNEAPSEGHRFLTAVMLLAPAVGAYALAGVRGAWPVRAGFAVVLLATAASGVLWRDAFVRQRLGGGAPPRERTWIGDDDPMAVDCRAWTGPMRRGPAPLTWAPTPSRYIYAGCQPVRLSGHPAVWSIVVQGTQGDWEDREQLGSVRSTDPLAEIVCPARDEGSACRWAREALRCEALPGGRFRRCVVPRARVGQALDRL